MPNQYIENSERWLSLAEPDFFILFVKAWIPFNAFVTFIFWEGYIKTRQTKYLDNLC